MRTVYIANRLPISIALDENGYSFKTSPGGVASGLRSHINTQSSENLWIGWPGISVPSGEQEKLKEKMLKEQNAYPVFLSPKLTDGYYNGFCNKVIWPLFHYFTDFVQIAPEYWNSYVSANEHFANKIIPLLRDDDIIHINDYQLMLLPQLLRKHNKNLSISFFLHVPFPALDVFRMLPQKWRVSLLEGMLGADLVGFHTHEYRQHFLSSALRILEAESNMGNITWDERIVKADVFPIGIDVEKYKTEGKSEKVRQEVTRLKKTLGKRKLIFSVDRLDYTKGIENRLLGFEEFLKQHPEWHDNVSLIVSSEPSRSDIDQYIAMKRRVDELVGKINGLYGGVSWQPIIYQYTSLTFEQMVGFYKTSDVALITPLRDGMNLVAKEYIASQDGGKGALILSEMAGSAKELSEAIIINPFDIQEIAEGIHQALTQSEEKQIARNKRMLKRLERYDIHRWADDIHSSLIQVKKEQKIQRVTFMTKSVKQEVVDAYRKATSRLIFLDYDGTLVPYENKPEQARPAKSVKERLSKLASEYKNEVVIVSGRDRKTLGNWLDMDHLSLVAEHGTWKKAAGSKHWSMFGRLTNTWKGSVISLLQKWVDRVPKSFIEEKEYSVAWHYRQVDPELASLVTKEVLFELTTFISTIEAEAVHDNKVIEIKNIGANKGAAAQQWLHKKKYDFILAIGDARTDEDLFGSLPDSAFSIKVGQSPSIAKHRMDDSVLVWRLLDELLEDNPKATSQSPHFSRPSPIIQI